MRNYKVGIIGYFARGKSKAGGQEAKTCSIDRAMKEKYGKEAVYNVDTTDWKRRPIGFFVQMVKMVLKCENIIMLPAQNGLLIFLPFFSVMNILLHRKIFYSVVGGWLPDYLEDRHGLSKRIGKIDHIFVETKSMKDALLKANITNVSVVPNFKYLVPVKHSELKCTIKEPYKLCTFSRVMKEKGIEDIVSAVRKINDRYKKNVFQLDIYGKIDDGYIKRFEDLKKNFPDYIKYAGQVEPEYGVEIVKNYFALVFPTRYYTEGVPGTLIDSYMAGVPAIVALWKNHEDVFIENVTGWGYKFGNQEDLERVLNKVVLEPELFVKMKKSTLNEAVKYLPDKNVEIMTSYFK